MPSNPPGYMRQYYAARHQWFAAYQTFRRERNREANGERMKPARSARLWAGLRQADVAQCLGVSTATYCDYETGASEFPLQTMLRAIAHLANVSVENLLRESEGFDMPLPRKRREPIVYGGGHCSPLRAGRLPALHNKNAAGAVAAAPTAGTEEVDGDH